jgi:hypothetical protein
MDVSDFGSEFQGGDHVEAAMRIRAKRQVDMAAITTKRISSRQKILAPAPCT